MAATTDLTDKLTSLLGPDGVELAPDQLRFFAEDALDRKSVV